MIEFIDMIVWIYSLFASALYVAVVFSGYSTNIEDDERKDVYIRKVKPKKGAARPMLTKDNWKSKLLQTSFWHVPESSDKEQHQSFLQYLNFVSGISLFVLRNKPKTIQIYNFSEREDGRVRFTQCSCKDTKSTLDPDLLMMSPFVEVGNSKSDNMNDNSCWNENFYTSPDAQEEHKLTTLQNGQLYFDESKGIMHIDYGWYVFPRQKFAQKFASPKTAKKMLTKMEVTLNDDGESLDWTMLAEIPEGNDKGKRSNIVRFTTYRQAFIDKDFVDKNWNGKYKEH